MLIYPFPPNIRRPGARHEQRLEKHDVERTLVDRWPQTHFRTNAGEPAPIDEGVEASHDRQTRYPDLKLADAIVPEPCPGSDIEWEVWQTPPLEAGRPLEVDGPRRTTRLGSRSPEPALNGLGQDPSIQRKRR
jgi:hypothetical protein